MQPKHIYVLCFPGHHIRVCTHHSSTIINPPALVGAATASNQAAAGLMPRQCLHIQVSSAQLIQSLALATVQVMTDPLHSPQQCQQHTHTFMLPQTSHHCPSSTHLSLGVLLQLAIKLLLASCHANASTSRLPVLSCNASL
jgi:hypothetical protein